MSAAVNPSHAPSSTAVRAGRVIREYASQGWHRTGTRTDRQSAHWLARQVQEIGLHPELEPFPLSRVQPRLCVIEIAGRQIEGLPLFDGRFTGQRGVRGTLGRAGTSAEVGLVQVSPSGRAEALEEARRSGTHQALVVVTTGGSLGLAPRNADSFAQPFGPPALQVGSEAGALLEEHAERGTTARVVVSARRYRTQAFNVVARLDGSDGKDAPLVVMTPRSGWWRCASERGGGLACWLETMRTLCGDRPRRPVVFVASSGHELGHLGIEAFIARSPGLPAHAYAWLHFGACIGAALDSRFFLFASDDALQGAAQAALRREGARPITLVPRGTPAGGEARNIHERGGRYVSLVGGSSTFHLEADRWPEAVDVASVARFAAGFAALAARLVRE